MFDKATEELLKDPRVIQEINKHKWFESEKAGHDIGFEKAARDWMKRYGSQWIKRAQGSSGSAPAQGRQWSGTVSGRPKRG